MCEKRYFLDDRQSVQLQCVCGGSIVVLDHDPHADLVGCQKCGGVARVGSRAQSPVECRSMELEGLRFYLENHGPEPRETHCGQPMVILDPGDHLIMVGCQKCGAVGNIGPNSSPDTWPPDDK